MRGAFMQRVVNEIDEIDTSDPERAHGELDELLMIAVPIEVAEAARRLMAKCDWWASA